MIEIVLLQLGAVFVYDSLWFVTALRMRRNDVADVAWGIGFIILAVVAQMASSNQSGRALVLLAMVAVWALRLSIHIGMRNRGKAEDSRYRKWREEWGANAAVRSYFQVFLLQGFLSGVVLLPVTYVFARPGVDLGVLDGIGAAIWLTGFGFEAIGVLLLIIAVGAVTLSRISGGTHADS